MPAIGQQAVMLARMAAQHDAELLVSAVLAAPVPHIVGQRAANATGRIVHRALGVGWIEKHPGQSVTDRHAFLQHAGPVSTGNPDASGAGLQ